MGQTFSKISKECGVDRSELTPRVIKDKMEYFPVPSQEVWRVGLLHELFSDNMDIPGFNKDEIDDMVAYLCKD